MPPIEPRDLVDPALLPLLDLIPTEPFTAETIVARRAALVEMRKARPVPEGALQPEERYVPGPAGAPDVRVLVWRSPLPSEGPLPAVLQIHGGGYVAGEPEMSAGDNRALVEATACVLVAVDYRLAPEHPHPAALEDCYAVLGWLAGAAGELGIDPGRIAITGISAGGGLAAALALLARDRGEVTVAFQHLIYPMLDDRTCVHSDPHPHTGAFVWGHATNAFGWGAMLGAEPGSEGISPYAAPARATDLSGLPPTYIAVGSLDLFLEENLEYARRLTRAGVPVELHVYPGAFHGFEMMAEAPVARQARRDHQDALVRALAG